MANSKKNYWSIPRLPRGQTVAILAGGPSLTLADVCAVSQRWRTIAINDSYRLVTEAGGSAWLHYFCDAKWYAWHKDRPEFAARAAGMTATLENRGHDMPGIFHLRNLGQMGWEPGTRDGIFAGRNSGYQALYIALMAGAARVVLLGYDMTTEGDRTHWHGGHPAGRPNAHTFERFSETLDQIAKIALGIGCDVVNTSPITTLRCFRRAALQEEIGK